MTFTEMIEKSYAFNPDIYYKSDAWRRARELYVLREHDGMMRIPKKIHQIWLGSEVPEAYKVYMDTWTKFHPDWEYKLWTDADVPAVNIKSSLVYSKAINPAMKSDILRYEILRQYGGLYVDTDFECVRPFDDLMDLKFFTGISYDDTFVIYNGLIASIPNHPILKASTSIVTSFMGRNPRMIIETTGAYHFTRCFNDNITWKTVAFPMDYFYPYPNNDKDRKLNPNDFITEFTYAIHHWCTSWIK
jgi:mannosyltransferase OCH1-like enzyme